MTTESDLVTVGWREWVSLPDIGVRSIKAKIDTGAKTSALHAFDVEIVHHRGIQMVLFKVHPYQRNFHYTVTSQAPLLDRRTIRNSGGHESLRPVIRTTIMIGPHRIATDITLASRDSMGFRMLLGRDALKYLFLVDPSRSFLIGKRKRAKARN